jgi:hypothetical protein
LRLVVRNAVQLSLALVLFAGSSFATRQAASASPKSSAAKSSSIKSNSSKSKSHKKGKRKTSWKKHGQQGIQADRARDIQEALIREKYLTGEANGVWDARSQAAMAKYQTDNGWQSKVTPDSRALIKLGLGPDHSQQSLLNGTPGANGVASATTPRATSAPEKQ